MNDLDKIKDLLGSEDPINRELGVVLALSQGMSLDNLVDKCYNKKWFYIEDNGYVQAGLLDFELGNYKLLGYSDHSDLRNELLETIILKSEPYVICFKKLIVLLLEDNYPELLNKINK